jgi:predicted ArsR family transcriptional regulator
MTSDSSSRSSRQAILSLLRSDPRTAGELAEAIDISPQAVRDQLRTLEGKGWIEVDRLRRDTGGKPAREYVLTAAGEESFDKPYGQLLRYLVGELEERLGGRRKRELLAAVGRRIGAELAGEGSAAADGADGLGPEPLRERLERAAGVLNALGGAARVEETGDGLQIRSDGCPLSGLVAADPEACRLAEALVETVAGVDVRETCDRSPRARCRFHVDEGV